MNASRQNLVVLRGALAAEPQDRTLPSGSVAVQFDVRTALGDAGDGAAATVPVSWIDPSPTDAGVARGRRRHRRDRCRVHVASSASAGRRRAGPRWSPRSIVPRRRTRSVRSAIARSRRFAGRLTVWSDADIPATSRSPNPADRWREVRALREPWRMMAKVGSVARQPRGRGRPVMVIPGFTANDASTIPLRSYLGGLGYECRGWGLGVNSGDLPTQVAADDRAGRARGRGTCRRRSRWSGGASAACRPGGGAGPPRRDRTGHHVRHAAVGPASHHHVDGAPYRSARRVSKRRHAGTQPARGSCGRSRRSTAATTASCTGKRASIPIRTRSTSRCRAATSAWASTPTCGASSPRRSGPAPVDRPRQTIVQVIGRITRPVRSFGVKNVDFGGIRSALAGGALDLGDADGPDEHGRRRRRRPAPHRRRGRRRAGTRRGASSSAKRVLQPEAVEGAQVVERSRPRGQPLPGTVRADEAEHTVALHRGERGAARPRPPASGRSTRRARRPGRPR